MKTLVRATAFTAAKYFVSGCIPMLVLVAPAHAAGAPPAAAGEASAADHYKRAAAAINVDCPANSDLEYPSFPPLGDEWTKMEAAAWEQNAAARQLAREARSIGRAQWPGKGDLSYLNVMRQVANEVADAALSRHFHGDDAGAIENVR